MMVLNLLKFSKVITSPVLLMFQLISNNNPHVKSIFIVRKRKQVFLSQKKIPLNRNAISIKQYVIGNNYKRLCKTIVMGIHDVMFGGKAYLLRQLNNAHL